MRGEALFEFKIGDCAPLLGSKSARKRPVCELKRRLYFFTLTVFSALHAAKLPLLHVSVYGSVKPKVETPSFRSTKTW